MANLQLTFACQDYDHTRALTDRDDTLTLRLYGENEGPALLGYHP